MFKIFEKLKQITLYKRFKKLIKRRIVNNSSQFKLNKIDNFLDTIAITSDVLDVKKSDITTMRV